MTKPAPGPAAVKGKKVVFIPFSESSPFGVQAVDAAKISAKALGWKLTVIDGKYVPTTQGNAIREAIAQKADGIAMYAVDCPSVQSALQQAVKAGIKVVAGSSQECEPPLFSREAITHYGSDSGWNYANGVAKADWIISKTNGKGSILIWDSVGGPQAGATVINGFNAEIKKYCPGCKVVTVKFNAADTGAQLKQEAAQALLKHPDVDAMDFPYDDPVVNGMGAAIQASGRKIWVMSAGGSAPMIALVKANPTYATLATDAAWQGGYGPIDALNRAFAGKPAANNGFGFLIADHDHNLNAAGTDWVDPVNAQAAFTAIWSGQTP